MEEVPKLPLGGEVWCQSPLPFLPKNHKGNEKLDEVEEILNPYLPQRRVSAKNPLSAWIAAWGKLSADW